MNVCRVFISSRRMNNHIIFSCYGSFALARSAVLVDAIERIKQADKTRIIYGEKILPGFESFKKALLNICLKLMKSWDFACIILKQYKILSKVYIG